MKDLTERQEAVFKFVLSFREKHGRTPTGPEIADHFGYKDPSSAYQHLDLIEKKGYLRVTQPKERAALQITPTEAGTQAAKKEWPVFGSIPAGPVSDVSSDDAVSIRSVEDLFPMIQPDDYFLTVNGDSMIEAGLTEGMTLLMRPPDNPSHDVSDGDICAVWVEGDGGTLKRVYFEAGTVHLVPENTEYDKQTYPAQRIRIQGVLVAALSILSFQNGG